MLKPTPVFSALAALVIASVLSGCGERNVEPVSDPTTVGSVAQPEPASGSIDPLGPFLPGGSGTVSVESDDGYVGTGHASWSALKVVTAEQVAALPCWQPPRGDSPLAFRAVHIKRSFEPGTVTGFTWMDTRKARFDFSSNTPLVDWDYVLLSRDGVSCTDPMNPPQGNLQIAATTEEANVIMYSEMTRSQPKGQWPDVKGVSAWVGFNGFRWRGVCDSGWNGSDEDSRGELCKIDWGVPN